MYVLLSRLRKTLDDARQARIRAGSHRELSGIQVDAEVPIFIALESSGSTFRVLRSERAVNDWLLIRPQDVSRDDIGRRGNWKTYCDRDRDAKTDSRNVDVSHTSLFYDNYPLPLGKGSGNASSRRTDPLPPSPAAFY